MKNVLFLTADELRADGTGFMGNPTVRTPHLDALAARGTVFERHFAPFPKCVPARCAMQTGRYTHSDGLRSVMGDYAGQYGLVEKWDSSLQDCLPRVPLTLAGPGIPVGRRVPGLTEHVDLPATILDYLGLAPGPDWIWHGASMLPALAGGPTKPAVFADGGHEAALRARFNAEVWQEVGGRRVKATEGKQLTYQQCPDAMARAKMVRTEEWKLVDRETGGNELYHRAADPCEMRNLYGDPAHAAVVADLQLRLLEWCLQTDPDRPRLKQVGA